MFLPNPVELLIAGVMLFVAVLFLWWLLKRLL